MPDLFLILLFLCPELPACPWLAPNPDPVPAVRGRLVDELGDPVAAAVEIYQEVEEGETRIQLADNDPRAGRLATSDGEGFFELRPLEGEASFALEIRAAGFVPHAVTGIDLRRGEGEVGELVLTRETLQRVFVEDEDGAPIPGVDVRMIAHHSEVVALVQRGVPSEVIQAFIGRVTTDAEGWAELAGFERGTTARLTFKHPSFIDETLHVTVGEEVIEQVLRRGLKISGRVVDADGGGIEGATVFASFESVSPGSPVMSLSLEDGFFELAGLEKGRVMLMVDAQDQGFLTWNERVDLEDGRDVEDLRVELSEGVELSGTVVGAAGDPVAGASVHVTVELKGSTHGRGATTDADGRFVMRGLLSGVSGEARLVATEPRHGEARRDLVLEPAMAPVTVRLEPGPSIAGRVVDAAARPVASARVEVRGEGHHDLSAADETGSFYLPLERGGSYLLRATKSGWGVEERAVVVGSEPLRDLELVLSRGAEIHGWVEGLEPEDWPRVEIMAEVMASSAEESSPESLLRFAVPRRGGVDPKGHFRVTGLEPGRWRIEAQVRGSAARTEAEVEIPSAEAAVRQDLLFEDTGLVLEGVVLVNGAPVDGVTVHPGGLTTDLAGRFRLEGLEPGPVTLVAVGAWGSVERRDDSHQGEVVIEVETRELRGTVFAADGRPAAGLLVMLEDLARGGEQGGARTGEDGRFAFPPRVVGRYRLLVHGRDRSTVAAEVELDRDLDVELHLAQPGVTNHAAPTVVEPR